MRVIHKFSVLVGVVLATASAFGQKEGATYVVEVPIPLAPVPVHVATGLGNPMPKARENALAGENAPKQLLPAGCQFTVVKVITSRRDEVKDGVTRVVLIRITQLPEKVTCPNKGTFFEIDNFDYQINRLFHLQRRTEEPIATVQHTFLSIPFRYEFKDSSVQPGGAIGDFIDITPRAAKYVHFGTFLGISALSGTALTNAATVTSTSTFGLTGGAGIMFDIPGGNLQAGFILGLDHVGSVGTTYAYNDRPWVAVSLGYKFIGN